MSDKLAQTANLENEWDGIDWADETGAGAASETTTPEVDEMFLVRRPDGSPLDFLAIETPINGLDDNLPPPSLTNAQAKDEYAQAVGGLKRSRVAINRLMKQRGWIALGFSTQEKMLEKIAADSGISVRTLFRQAQTDAVRAAVGVGVTDQQAELLAKLPQPAQAAALARAKEIHAAAPAPIGKAAQFYKPDRPTAKDVAQAVAEFLPEPEESHQFGAAVLETGGAKSYANWHKPGEESTDKLSVTGETHEAGTVYSFVSAAIHPEDSRVMVIRCYDPVADAYGQIAVLKSILKAAL